MQVIVTPDGLGGERFTNRKNGKHASLLCDPAAKHQRWYVFQGGHEKYDLNRAGFGFMSRRSAISLIETLIR
jgi:hypothetical protein